MSTHITVAVCLLLATVAYPADLTDQDFQTHAEQLRGKLAAEFTVVVAKPFVVAGDQGPRQVRSHASHVVQWAVERLKKQYFAKDPDHIIDIYLFKDAESYRRHAKELFDHEPSTPFGYYSGAHRALVMNISTGGGTLVHELVHPFMSANFKACPAWFNEGLGSLYEQSSDRDGKIWGLTNWRLAGLQKAIRAGKVPSFKSLCSTTDRQFYDEDSGTNYAQARYLCYYLQEKGLLERFYREFVEKHAEDPTGYATLQSVLGVEDMTAFQEHWETFVLGLKFP